MRILDSPTLPPGLTCSRSGCNGSFRGGRNGRLSIRTPCFSDGRVTNSVSGRCVDFAGLATSDRNFSSAYTLCHF